MSLTFAITSYSVIRNSSDNIFSINKWDKIDLCSKLETQPDFLTSMNSASTHWSIELQQETLSVLQDSELLCSLENAKRQFLAGEFLSQKEAFEELGW